MSAGDGYLYYTNSVATGDVQRQPGTAMTDYYAVDGNPPGVWMGGAAALLGVSGEVTEAQMRALFGEGLHPDADAITTALGEQGATADEIRSAIALGRAYYRYDVKDTQLKQAVEAAADEFERVNGRAPSRDERRQLRMREGAISFRDAYGRQPASKEELAKYVTAALKPAQHAVAGIDHTFSVPKSVSIAWALADPEGAAAIEAAHERAIARTLQRLEEEALATRAGVNGVRQTEVRGGVLATRFRHFESRTGDPHLHDHVVISNKVQGADGVWRTLDSRLLLRSTVFLSETYNRSLFDELEAIGYRSQSRVVTAGKAPVMEIAGVDDRLIDTFSTRGAGIKPVMDRLVDEYTQTHGRAPDNVAARKLSERAWQETRPAKQHRTVSALKADAWQRARLLGFSERTPDTVPWAPRQATRADLRRAREMAPVDVYEAAAEVMRKVETARSTWGEHHVKAEIERFVSHHRDRRFTVTDAGGVRELDRGEVERTLLRTTLQLDSIPVTPEHVHGRFRPLTRADGESFYTSKGRTLYTSTRILEAEARLLSAARQESVTAAPVDAATFAHALEQLPNTDAAQVALARGFATSRTQLVLGVGPAGAGKTRSMKLAARAVSLAGGRMIGLAPSKKAATVFGRDVGVDAFTIDGFLTAHRAAIQAGEEISERYRIGSGDVVVIDEAAMATSASLDEVVQLVTNAGGYVRAVFDHNQISAVGAGGAMRWLYKEVGALELQKVYRFTNPEEAAASLVLRESAPGVDPFAWYKANGRIIAGTKDELVEVVFTRYLADVDAGRESVMIVPTLDYLSELNTRAQAHAIATGHVTGTSRVLLRDGNHAHVGDRIMTRLNSPDLLMNQGRDSVENGSLFTVTTIHGDGSVTATHQVHGGTVRLPVAYLKEHTHLGYAITAHGSQGETYGEAGAVEGNAHGIITKDTTRAAAYVPATRGVTGNYLYVEVEPGQHPDDVLATIARNVDTNLAAHEQIDVESARILDLARLVDEHNDVAAHANAIRFETLARRVLDTDADRLIHSAGWEAAAAGLTRADKYGLDPADVLAQTWAWRDFGDAEDVGAVMSWRIETHLDEQENAGVIEPLKEPGADTGYYEWAIDRSARNHPDVPDEWRTHLAERADYIDQRMSLRGAELTVERPAWTEQLGPVPADPKAQKTWMRLAAEVDLFRARYNIPATEAVAIPEQYRNAPAGKNLASRVAALHKSTAIRTNAGTATPAASADQLRRISELARRVEPQRPVADAEHAARALTPDRPTGSDARLADLLRKAEERGEDIKRTGDDLAAKTERNRAEQPDVDAPASTPDVSAATRRGPSVR